MGVRQPSRPLKMGQNAMPYGSRSASKGTSASPRPNSSPWNTHTEPRSAHTSADSCVAACDGELLQPQRLTTRSTSWLEIVQHGQLSGARLRRFSTVSRMCRGELSLLSSSNEYAMCSRPGCVYSATVAVESSEEISPSATTPG